MALRLSSDGARVVTEWFEEFFDERYLLFFEEAVHRGAPEAEIDFIEQALALEPGASILELGCGFGRHAIPLAQRGYAVTGVDLSDTLLRVARGMGEQLEVQATWVRLDLRDLGGIGPYDACTCLYTVFGYFDDAENAAVLTRVRDVLRPGGRLLLDVNNPLAILCRLGDEWSETEHGVRRESSHYDPMTGTLITDRVLHARDGRRLRLPTSRVRLYPPHELAALLRASGFEIEQVHGGLQGSPFVWQRSFMQTWVATRV